VGLLTVFTVVAFEAVAVATALPTAARDLNGLGSFGWAFTGFLAASVVGMVAGGRISAARGAARPLMGGLLAFGLGLVLAGVATSMGALITGRVVQGLGGGLLLTSAYVVIGTLYPPELRSKMLAALAAVWVVPALVGPVLAGAVAQHLSWRLVFLGLVPVVIAAGALTLSSSARWGHVAPADRTSSTARADVLLATRAIATALGVSGIAQLGQHQGPIAILLGVASMGALIWGLHGLLPPGTVGARRGVGAAIAFRGLISGAFTGLESVVPLLLTLQHGWSPTAAGLPLTATAVTWSAASWWQGRVDRPNRVPLVRWGFALLIVGGICVAVLASPSAPAWLAVAVWPLAGVGAGLVLPSAGVLLLGATNDTDRGRDTAALQLVDACLGALATSVAGALLATADRGAVSYSAAFALSAAILSSIALVGFTLAGRARPAGAA
jgi:MFS family permease